MHIIVEIDGVWIDPHRLAVWGLLLAHPPSRRIGPRSLWASTRRPAPWSRAWVHKRS